MNWTEIISLLGGLTGITAVITTVYTMKVKKESQQIDNLRKIIDELQEDRDILRREFNEYKENSEKRFSKNELIAEQNKKKIDQQSQAINLAYRCKAVENIGCCPVLQHLQQD